MALPIPPIITLPTPTETGDKLVKDEKVRASTLIRDGGWRGSDVRIGTAVMGAESGYDPTIYNGICCVGLMQVNLIHAGDYGIPADRDAAMKWLKNPRNNVEAAHRIWRDQGWEAWEAFTNQNYKRFMGQDPMITVNKNTVGEGVTGAAGAAIDAALGPVDELAGAILNPSTWLRVGKGALGGSLLVLGTGALVFIVANKAAKSNVARQAMKVAPGPTAKAIRKVT